MWHSLALVYENVSTKAEAASQAISVKANVVGVEDLPLQHVLT